MTDNISRFENKKKESEWCMGIDEAGRGPVVGPMVYGCCVWALEDEEELKKEGFFDSKQLSEEKREIIFDRMQKLQNDKLYFEVKVLSAQFLSNKMLAIQRDSLNQLSFQAAYFLINSVLNQGFNVSHIYIDTVGKKETYQANLERDYKDKAPNTKFTVSEKADAKFPVVGAASICAKVTRDLIVKNEQIKEGTSIPTAIGSGYPSDPATKKWLQDSFDGVFGFSSNVRFSWSTVENIFTERGLQVNFFDGQDNANGKKQMSIQSMTQAKKLESKGYFAKKIGISKNFDL